MKAKAILTLTLAATAALMSTAVFKANALDNYVSTLGKADGLVATYSVTTVDGGTEQFSVSLAKPNLARIETSSRVIVADGTDITTFEKGRNQYYKVPQTAAALAEIFSPVEFQAWTPFFDSKAFAKVAKIEDKGSRKRGGKTMNMVQISADAKGDTVMTFHIDESDNLTKQATFDIKTLTGTRQMVLNAEKVSLTRSGADTFAFKAPEGAQFVDIATLKTGKWLYDFDEAVKAAQATNSIIMVDFMATWCGPCKMMDAEVFQTSEFKELTKDMVLVKIDVDIQQALAARYGVTAMPTVKFLDKSGSIIHEFVGYGGFQQVMGEVRKAKSMKK